MHSMRLYALVANLLGYASDHDGDFASGLWSIACEGGSR